MQTVPNHDEFDGAVRLQASPKPPIIWRFARQWRGAKTRNRALRTWR
jgi:hypothetical protein